MILDGGPYLKMATSQLVPTNKGGKLQLQGMIFGKHIFSLKNPSKIIITIIIIIIISIIFCQQL